MSRTPRLRSTRLVLLLLALGLVAAACGGDSEVGSGVKVDEKGKAGALRDEATTTTTTATTLPPSTTTTKPTTATTQRQTTTTVQPVAVVIKVQDDEQGIAFDPPQVRVKKGAVVEWTNTSTTGKTRQIKAENGAFRSPPIPPGGTWRWTANVAGTHNYADETRPYAVAAKIQVG